MFKVVSSDSYAHTKLWTYANRTAFYCISYCKRVLRVLKLISVKFIAYVLQQHLFLVFIANKIISTAPLTLVHDAAVIILGFSFILRIIFNFLQKEIGICFFTYSSEHWGMFWEKKNILVPFWGRGGEGGRPACRSPFV